MPDCNHLMYGFRQRSSMFMIKPMCRCPRRNVGAAEHVASEHLTEVSPPTMRGSVPARELHAGALDMSCPWAWMFGNVCAFSWLSLARLQNLPGLEADLITMALADQVFNHAGACDRVIELLASMGFDCQEELHASSFLGSTGA